MILSIIVAMDRERAIGRNNELPWRLSDDLKLFKQRTMGHHIIVGRKTYQSIGRALPGRTMIVVSRDEAFQAEGCVVVASPQAAVDYARLHEQSECFVCGGGELYRQLLPLCDKIYLSEVDTVVSGDAHFPEFEATQWREVERTPYKKDEKNEYDWTLVLLERIIEP